MTRRFRMTIELDMPDGTTAKQAKALLGSWLDQGASVSNVLRKSEVVDESPAPGVQAAFIYDSGGRGACHAVVKKKNGPWSENRFGFCGVEPEVGPVGSIDQPDGGMCGECRRYVQKGPDGLWYVKPDAPLPKPKMRATVDCGGCDDD